MSLLGGRWTGRLGTTAFVLAALALGRVVGDELPQPFDRLGAPREHHVAVGEPARLRTAEVTVTGVRVGPALDDLSATLTTPGVWVVADLEITPTDADASLATWEVVAADGTEWGRTRALVDTCRSTPPAITQRCGVAVEVLPDAVPGARLRLATQDDVRYDDRAVVDLGLTADDVSGAADDPLPVAPFEMEGP
jgi:hypothetical protein